MGRFDSEKVWLPGALQLLAELEPLRRGLLVGELAHRFGCSRRAAEDALTVLLRGGYVERTNSLADGRGRDYRVSERGHALVAHPGHPGLLRLARRLLTACPSEKERRAQRRQGSLAERQRELARRERLLLQKPIREETLAERAATFAVNLTHLGYGYDLESAINLAMLILPLLEQLPDSG
jgi:DNA-binding MarR family transcriptional regulator